MANQFADGYLYKQGATPQTRVVTSTRFKIYSDAVGVGAFQRMGVCSSFNISESRQIDAVRGLGYGDQIAELVPGVTQPMTLQITRTALYLANIYQMLGYKAGISGLVRSLKHHRWPFDIRTEIVFSQLATEDNSSLQSSQATKADVAHELGGNNLGNPGLMAVATVYQGCWVDNYTNNYSMDQSVVTEDVGVTVHDIIDIAGSLYGEFIDSGMNSGDATGRSLIYNS